MSLGFGIGDFLAISKLARSVWVQFQDSPEHLMPLAMSEYAVMLDACP